MQRILIFNRDQTNSGGQEIVAQIIASGLFGKGHQVTMLTTSSEEQFASLPEGVDVVELGAKKFVDDKVLEDPEELKEFLEVHEFDIALINNPLNLIAQKVIQQLPASTEVWCSFHGKMNVASPVKALLNNLRKFWYINRAARKSTGFIYLNDEDQEYFSKYLFGKKISSRIIHNGVDETDFAYAKKATGADAKTNFLFVGVLRQMKGVPDLIEAIGGIDSELLQKAEFNFVGRDWEGLGEKIEALESCNYLGLQPRENVKELMKKSDVQVLPSYSECMPMVILEAMSCGNLILSTDIYGISQIFHGQEGNILIKPGDVDALRQSLSDLIGDKERINKVGKVNRELVEEHYTQSLMIEKYEQAFAQAD